jgi:hypothetical protein
MAIPGYQADIAEVSAILAIGALALLAGHRWGILIVAAADLLLIGHVWPVAAFADRPEPYARIAACTAMLGALPGLLVFSRTLPHTVSLLLGPRLARARGAGTALCSAAALIFLTSPAISRMMAPAQPTAVAVATTAGPSGGKTPARHVAASAGPVTPVVHAIPDDGASLAASVVDTPVLAPTVEPPLLDPIAADAPDLDEDEDEGELAVDAVSGADPAAP